jgi:hypothetical protein
MSTAIETETEAPEVEYKTETERLEAQKTRFMSVMEEAFGKDSDRMKKLVTLYEDYGDRLIEAPASGKVHYHNAYAGGYIDHVLHVYDCAIDFAKVLRRKGGSLDFTKSELTMAAIHHDLWKLGSPNGEPYYVPQNSDWHRKNQNEMFKNNDRLPYMKVTDGAVFILQSRGIELTYKEWLSIKLSDGLYDESNKSYYVNYGKFPIHTNLPYVIHWADHMATTTERDPLKQEWLAEINE